MRVARVIPCLDVDAGRVVKGVNFVGLRDAGDPVELAARYDAEGADELVFLDITASSDGRATMVDVVEHVAESVFIPFTVGGGIRTPDDVRQMLRAGADKVSLNTAAVDDPSLVTRASDEFGAQCVVVAIDARRWASPASAVPDVSPGSASVQPDAGHPGGDLWEVVVHGGRTRTGRSVLEWAAEAVRLGAGEILLTSMDRDGTRDGFDLELTSAIVEAVDVPVIASGGVGTLDHLADGIEAGASAVLAASIFHFGDHTVAEAKAHMSHRGIVVRPCPE